MKFKPTEGYRKPVLEVEIRHQRKHFWDYCICGRSNKRCKNTKMSAAKRVVRTLDFSHETIAETSAGPIGV